MEVLLSLANVAKAKIDNAEQKHVMTWENLHEKCPHLAQFEVNTAMKLTYHA